MIKPLVERPKRILIDINTQNDFFLAGGSCCIRNHRRILARIRRIMAWARSNDITIISICEVNTNNGDGNGDGQGKIRYTLLSNNVSFSADCSADLPRDLLQRHRQIILHKRCLDPFDEPRIERFLSEVRADEFILIGASIEGAVEKTALGLLQRGKRVRIVIDAVGMHDRREAKLAMGKMETKGAKLLETKMLAGVSHLQQVGICGCNACKRMEKVKSLSSDVLVGV